MVRYFFIAFNRKISTKLDLNQATPTVKAAWVHASVVAEYVPLPLGLKTNCDSLYGFKTV